MSKNKEAEAEKPTADANDEGATVADNMISAMNQLTDALSRVDEPTSPIGLAFEVEERVLGMVVHMNDLMMATTHGVYQLIPQANRTWRAGKLKIEVAL
jgi:hypothetical protein